MKEPLRSIALVATFLAAQVVPVSATSPDTQNSTWGSTLGVSPKNRTVPDNYRYKFRGTLRDLSGAPIPGFPASQMELDFSDCFNPSTRPANQIPADGPSDLNGQVTWSLNLDFGGGDPCGARVLIQNVVFKILAPHQGLPNSVLDGGLRSPDQNGDGVISLPDLGVFQMEFVNSGPRVDYRGDIGQGNMPFDGVTDLIDLGFFQVHFLTP